MPQPNEGAATSLRLDRPGLGLGLDPVEVDAYLGGVDVGLIVQETRCDKGMQDNFALPTGTTVQLARHPGVPHLGRLPASGKAASSASSSPPRGAPGDCPGP